MMITIASVCVDVALADGDGTTDVIDSMNMLIAPSYESGASTYRGGGNYGVLFRTEDGFTEMDYTVVPGSLIHNDMISPSTTYPCGDPHCVNDGTDGVYNDRQSETCTYDTYMNAALGWVIGDEDALGNIFYDLDNIQTDDWGWGVFYATDANAVDQRCEYRDDWTPPGWDCPKGWFVLDDNTVPYPDNTFKSDGKRGAGFYNAGNPQTAPVGGGGGAGCHFGSDYGNWWINQWNSIDASTGLNLVRNKECECEYQLKGGSYPWEDWVNNLIYGDASGYESNLGNVQNKPILGNTGVGGPQYIADYAACWVNNPTDMIDLANALYYNRGLWLNGKWPTSAPDGSVEDVRRYPGWNEIPVDKETVSDKNNWTSIAVKLPANVCDDPTGATEANSVTLINDCLDDTAKLNLECQISDFVAYGYITPGSDHISTRGASSYVAILKEHQIQDDNKPGIFFREFYCENWISPNGVWEIVYIPKEDPRSNGLGACYIEYGPTWGTDTTINSAEDLLCTPDNGYRANAGGKPGFACKISPFLD